MWLFPSRDLVSWHDFVICVARRWPKLSQQTSCVFSISLRGKRPSAFISIQSQETIEAYWTWQNSQGLYQSCLFRANSHSCFFFYFIQRTQLEWPLRGIKTISGCVPHGDLDMVKLLRHRLVTSKSIKNVLNVYYVVPTQWTSRVQTFAAIRTGSAGWQKCSRA